MIRKASDVFVSLARNRKLRPLVYLICFHLSLSFTYIFIFTTTFYYGRRVMLLHLLLVMGCIFLLVLLGAGLVAIDRLSVRLIRLLLSGLAAVAFTTLLLLYVSNFISNRLWGDNISYDLVRNNIYFFGTYLQAIGLRPAWVYLIVGFGFSALFFAYFTLSGAVLVSIQELVSRARDFRLFSSPKRAIASAFVLIVICLAYAGTVSVVVWLIPGAATQKEPILSLLTPKALLANAYRLAPEEQRIREQYAKPRDFQRRNVIVIIADSLRADHTQAYGYQRGTTPFLDQLMREGHVKRVKLATTNCPATTCGNMSILTSRSVEKLRPGNLGVYDLLYDQGYKVYLILSGDHGGFPELKQSYGQNVSLYFDGASSRRFTPTDDRVLLEGLERVPPSDSRPAFFLFHLMSPHVTGIKFDSYEKYLPCRKGSELLVRRGWDPAEVTNCYDNRILQADDFIRQIFDVLTRKGYLAGSLVIITADHGDGLGEHAAWGHGRNVYQEQLSIPMLIYDTQDGSYKNLEYATQLDIAPTILDRLGLPVPHVWEGYSAFSSNGAEYSFHRTWRAPFYAAAIYRSDKGMFKYLYGEERGTEELYDLSVDPHETRNLMTTVDRILIMKMRAELAKHGIVVRDVK